MKEAKGLLVGSRCKANNKSIEVFEHAAPLIVDAAHRSISLAAARCHLDQGAWPVLRKGAFQVGDCFDLAVTQTHMRQRWKATQSSAQGGVQFTGHILGSLIKPRRKCFGLMEGKDGPTAWLRIKHACEACLDAGRFVGEGQRKAYSRQAMRKPGTVLHALFLDTGEGLTHLLRFDDTNRFTIHKEEIISRSGHHGEFTNRHSNRGTQVQASVILYDPACLCKSLINELARLFFWLHAACLFLSSVVCVMLQS